MKKPEKRTLYSTIGTTMALNDNDAGYNQAIQEYKKYLPDVEEIAITCYLTLKPATKENWKVESKVILEEFRGYGQAIAKRIGKGE